MDGEQEQARSQAQKRWIAKLPNDLVAGLENGGHSLNFKTELAYRSPQAGGGRYWDTTMWCGRCEERYRGWLWSRWFGLSVDRPCTGQPGLELGSDAIASVVFGIMGVFVAFLLIPSVVAVFFGHRERKKIKASNGERRGRVPATIGLTLGYIGLALAPVIIWGIWTQGLTTG